MYQGAQGVVVQDRWPGGGSDRGEESVAARSPVDIHVEPLCGGFRAADEADAREKGPSVSASSSDQECQQSRQAKTSLIVEPEPLHGDLVAGYE